MPGAERHHRAISQPHVRFYQVQERVGTPDMLEIGRRYAEVRFETREK